MTVCFRLEEKPTPKYDTTLTARRPLGEHKPGRIKRAAFSLQNQHYHICCFLIRPRLYASESHLSSSPEERFFCTDTGIVAFMADP